MTSKLVGTAEAILLLGLASLAQAACQDGSPRQQGLVATREDFRATESTLSLLEPHGARCVWAKVDVIAKTRLAVAEIDGNCRGGKIALSGDGKRGAVWFDPEATSLSMWGGTVAFPEAPASPGTRPRLFDIDLATGSATAVQPPAGMRELGFDSKRRLIALTVQELTEAETERGEAVVDGAPMKLEPPSDGVPVLVHAFSLEGDAWKRVETASSTVGWDLAMGVGALAAAGDLGFRSAEVLEPRLQGDDEVDAALLARLAGFAPQAHPEEGKLGWIRFGSGGTRLVVWEDGAELAYSTGLAAFIDPAGNPVKPAGWPYTENDRISYRWQGGYLLAAQDHVGTHPRLFRDGKPAWTSDTARAVTFWPPIRHSAR